MATIEIDDAGWGSLVGPVVLGVYRREDGRFLWRTIPVVYFQGAVFQRREYLRVGLELVQEMFGEMGATSNDTILCCSGSVLAAVREGLVTAGYVVQPAKIEGPLQLFVETTFAQVLQQIGLVLDLDTLTRTPGLAFMQELRWLKRGDLNARSVDPRREQFAKTGWRSYATWAGYPYDEATRARQRQQRGS